MEKKKNDVVAEREAKCRKANLIEAIDDGSITMEEAQQMLVERGNESEARKKEKLRRYQEGKAAEER